MRKSWAYRLFRIGAIPRSWREALARETVVIADEGLPGRMVMRDVRAPGKRFIGRSEGFSGWLAVTRERVVAFTYGRRQVHIATDDPRLRHLHADVPESGTLALSFESGAFRDRWSGVIEFRFRTGEAHRFKDALTAAGAAWGPARR